MSVLKLNEQRDTAKSMPLTNVWNKRAKVLYGEMAMEMCTNTYMYVQVFLYDKSSVRSTRLCLKIVV